MLSKTKKLLTPTRCLMIAYVFLLFYITYCKSLEHSHEAKTDYDEGSEVDSDGSISNSHEYESCPKHEYNRTCCNHGEFQCATGHCIPKQKLCDLKMDCPDHSDEDGCLNVNCSKRTTFKCEHFCENLGSNKSRCTCYKGFTLNKTTSVSCIDINECELGVHWCSHFCLNLNGSFGCTCMNGFSSNDEKFEGICKADDKNIQILYSSDAWIYSYSVEKHKVSAVVHAGKVDEMDIDPMTSMVYWSTRHRVGRSYLPGAENGSVTVGHPQSISPSSIWHFKYSLAVDWVAGNLYWISVDILNIDKYQILVSKLDGRYIKTVVDNVMFASCLVVDPENGKMYWTSGGDAAEIGSAWMNGMYRKPLAHLTTSKHPVALTLDHNNPGRLYWSDAKTHSIYFIYTDGTSPNKIITLGEADTPLMMDVFENYLYWVTKGSGKLVKFDKYGRGHMNTLVEKLINQTAVKVFHPRRVEVNIRQSGLRCEQQCSHLCLHVPRGYSCSCPDGSKLLIQRGEILCDTEIVNKLEEPLICNCDEKVKICNASLPEHKCHCPGVKCEDGVTQSPSYDDVTESPSYDDNDALLSSVEFTHDFKEGYELERYDKNTWIVDTIFLIFIIVMLICFALSFFKRSDQNGGNLIADNTSPVVGYNAENVSMQHHTQGGPTIVRSNNESPSRFNGFDNPSFLEEKQNLTGSTHQLVF